MSDHLIPSKSQLQSLIGESIRDMVKCSFETYEDHLEYLYFPDMKDYDDQKSFFKYSYGCLLIIFDNYEFTFASAEDLNSLIVKCEKKGDIIYDDYILNDVDVLEKTYVKQINDNTDFLDVLDQEIIAIDILSTNNLNAIQMGLPSEKGLRFSLKNNCELILSHNLTENSFVFSVLTKKDFISPATISKYRLLNK